MSVVVTFPSDPVLVIPVSGVGEVGVLLNMVTL